MRVFVVYFVVEIHERINDFFDGLLLERASAYGYSKSNMAVLRGDLDAVKSIDPVQYSNIMSCVHQMDKRTPITYAKDIVASWVFEDYILKALDSGGYRISLDGGDRKREFLSSRKVSGSSDFVITYKNRSLKFELMTNYTDYWQKYKRVDLRDSKYLKLATEKSVFVGINLPVKQFFIIDFNTPPPAIKIDSYRPYGGKSAYQIKLDNIPMYDLSPDNLHAALLGAIERR
jgi:hypothetical protein